jgi:hypothetical protein
VKTSLLLAGVIASAWTSDAQSETSVESRQLFSLPKISLREKTGPPAATPVATSLSVSLTETETDPVAVTLANYVKWNGWGWLSPRNIQDDQGGFYHWAKRKIFVEPAVIRIKHVEVSASVITALKTKNPMALLNPIVLSVSF